MDDRRKKALHLCHADLRTGITVTDILPKLHIDAGGFLTELESTTIRDKKTAGNVEQVDELVRVLATKETKDFDYFCDVLKKEGRQSYSNKLIVAAGLRDSEATDACASIIPDIMAEYVEVKGEFVSACTREGTPTLEEVKDFCIDLIECASKTMPRISRKEDDIEKAVTFTELARVVCFRLSKWVSYDFFKKVIARFQPALKSVQDRLMCYEDRLKLFLQQKLECIAELQQQEKVPGSMAELAVQYKLDADSLLLKDLVTERDFLAERLSIPEHLLQVISWGDGSIVITYWIVRDLLPLAELALCREDVRAELIQHGVEVVYLDSRPSEHPGSVDYSLQSPHLQRRAIVTLLDAHRQDLDVTSLTSDLKTMGILTMEQCQILASLDDKEKRHETLLYTLLAHEGPDTYDKLVECIGSRDTDIAVDLPATLEDLMKSPGALTVISSSQYTLRSPEERVARQIVETVDSEEPLQVELPKLRRSASQPNLREERIEISAGELGGGEYECTLQQEKRGSWKGALELELAAAKEAQTKLEEDVRLLNEELIKQLTQRDSEFHRYIELQERYRSMEDEFKLFKEKHADCDVTKKEQEVGALCVELTLMIFR